MAETAIFEPGGYRYVRGRFQYSGGVAAEPGFAIERARFHRPVPLEEGFRRIEAHLRLAEREGDSLVHADRTPEHDAFVRIVHGSPDGGPADAEGFRRHQNALRVEAP